MSVLHRQLLALIVAGSACLPAFAQTAPDAGCPSCEQPMRRSPAPSEPATVAPPDAGARPQEATPRILLKGFRIQGALRIQEGELQAYLRPFVGREVDIRQLKGLTAFITFYYRERGYLALTVLPPQEVKDGIVTLQIIEGPPRQLLIDNGDRIDAAGIPRFADHRFDLGGALNLSRRREAIAILSEQPGESVCSSLAAGRAVGEDDLAVAAAREPLPGATHDVSDLVLRDGGNYQRNLGVSLASGDLRTRRQHVFSSKLLLAARTRSSQWEH